MSRLGETRYNNQGCSATIVRYNSYKDIVVKFNDEFQTEVGTTYYVFSNGSFTNPYYKSVYGVGYIGVGKYKSRDNGQSAKLYIDWKNMMQRCYSKSHQKKKPSYIGCVVCEEWHNFQNFAKWHEENYYIIDNEKMALDKDLLSSENKMYSPNTCLFIPQSINSLFIGSNTSSNLPIGVSYTKKNNKNPYRAEVGTLNDKKYIGEYKTPQEAFYAYKEAKEIYIKEVAELYKDRIPKILYETMWSYEIKITD